MVTWINLKQDWWSTAVNKVVIYTTSSRQLQYHHKWFAYFSTSPPTIDRFLYCLKQFPLKFQLHLSRRLIDAGFRQSIHDECLFYKMIKSEFSYISTHSDLLIYFSCKTLAQEFKDTLIKIYNGHASSYISIH